MYAYTVTQKYPIGLISNNMSNKKYIIVVNNQINLESFALELDSNDLMVVNEDTIVRVYEFEL